MPQVQYARGKAFRLAFLTLFALVLMMSFGALMPNSACAETTYTIYFHRNYTSPTTTVKKVTTTNASAKISSLYAPSVVSGAVAGYGVSPTQHYLYCLSSAGNAEWQVFEKAQTSYPFLSASDKRSRGAGNTIAKIRELSGVKSTTLHLYLYYKRVNHAFISSVAATCTSSGSKSCSACGYTTGVSALGHSYASTVVQQPSCSAPGLRSFRCSRCGSSYSEGISATGAHSYVYASLGDGTHSVQCQACQAVGHVSSCTMDASGICTYCGFKRWQAPEAASTQDGVQTIQVASLAVTVGKVKISSLCYELRADRTAAVVSPADSGLKKIKVPSTVTRGGVSYKVTGIKSNAFKDCEKLKTVSGCANVMTLGKKAFKGCGALESIPKFQRLKSVGANAFRGCASLKKAALSSKKLESIGSGAFRGCSSLTKVKLSSKVLRSLGKSAFKGCSSMESFSCKSGKITHSMLKKACVV